MSFLSKKQARFTQLAILTLCLLTGIACSQTNKETTKMTASNPYNLQFLNGSIDYLSETNIPIHFNPNPNKVYEVIWEIKDAPVPLTQAMNPENSEIDKKGFLSSSYTAFRSDKGHSCKFHGKSPLYSYTPRAIVLFPIQQVDKNKFKTYYVADAILNEDYGLDTIAEPIEKMGICLWESTSGLSISLSQTGGYQEPVIGLNLVHDSKQLEQEISKYPITLYYKKDYLMQPVKIHHVENTSYSFILEELGKTRDEFPDLKDSDLFTITVSVKEISQF